MRRKKQRPGDEELVHDEGGDVVDRASALSRLAADGRADLIPLVRQWLSHEQPMLRSEAVSKLLVFWELEDDIPAVMAILHDDPDPDVRGAASRALSSFVIGTNRHRDMIVRALVRQLERDDDVITQRSCYEDLLRLLDRSRPEPPYDFDRDTHVDWELLTPWRAS